MRAIIFDADGTLVDVRHRLHYLSGEIKDWNAFHDAMVDDGENEGVAWLARLLDGAKSAYGTEQQYAVLVVTARHEPYRERTQTQMNDVVGIFPDRIYMRAEDDRRPDHEVKADILQQIVADGYEPFLVIDDRPEVVQMWRDWGLTCLQCAPDEPKSKVAGQVILTLLIGPSGAGKSTFASKNYRGGEIISTDRIRDEEGLGHTQDDLALTFKLARGYAKARIDAGLRAVIDATNLKFKDRMAFVRLAPKDAIVEYVLLDRDYDTKVRDRGWRSEELVGKHHRLFRDTTLADVKNADGLGNVVVLDKREHKV